jgi:hypothetical protein
MTNAEGSFYYLTWLVSRDLLVDFFNLICCFGLVQGTSLLSIFAQYQRSETHIWRSTLPCLVFQRRRNAAHFVLKKKTIRWKSYKKVPFIWRPLKVVGNEKVGGSGMCQTVPIWLRPRRSRFVSLSILPSSLILCISVSAPVKQNE